MLFFEKNATGLKQKLLLEALGRCKFGSLFMTLPTGEKFHFQGDQPGSSSDLIVKDIRCLDQFIRHGDIGLGETYMQGMWETSDLPNLLTFFLENIEAIEEYIHGKKWIQFFLSFSKILTKNSRKGSKRNIVCHYDLGNDFYGLWLDPSMTYSSALYEGTEKSLETAQQDKYQRILGQIPSHTDRVLEIGCGWGGFLENAGRQGLSVDGITLSPSQKAHTHDRIAHQKFQKQVNVQIRDYRDVREKYDSIVSIEMFEAVGESYWPGYFQTLKSALTEKGRAIIQTITIKDDVFSGYKNRTDFIQKHIFPGGMLPSKQIFKDLAVDCGLKVSDAFSFGSCYHRTLKAWLENFDRSYQKVRGHGFDDEFIRKWRFYLAYCMAGFKTGQTDVVQYSLDHS